MGTVSTLALRGSLVAQLDEQARPRRTGAPRTSRRGSGVPGDPGERRPRAPAPAAG